MAYKFNPLLGVGLDEVGAGSGAATPGGADTQVQFNDGGALGGDAGLVYDKTTDKLTVGGDIDLDDGGTFSTTLQTVTPTANRTVSIPDATGTIGLVNGPTGSIQFNEAGALNGTSDFSTTLNWNNAATTFTGLKLNVTNTASAAGSKLLDLQVGGTSAVQVTDNKIQYSSPVVALYTGTGAGGSVDIAGVGSLDTVPLRVDYSFITIAQRAKLGFTSGSNINTGIDASLSRDSAGVLKITDGSTGTGYLKLIPTTVGALTAAATVGAGTKAFVTDSTSTLSSHHGQVVVGGGSNFVPVFSDGTNWIVG
jgi:hypothetical protein